MKKNIILMSEYRKKKKDLNWLYSLSEYDLICEFIDSHNEYERDSRNPTTLEWLDTVSDVVSIRCFDKTNEK